MYDYNVNVRQGPGMKLSSALKKRIRRHSGRENQETYSLLEMGHKVITVLVLLQAGESHLRSGDVLERKHVIGLALGEYNRNQLRVPF